MAHPQFVRLPSDAYCTQTWNANQSIKQSINKSQVPVKKKKKHL